MTEPAWIDLALPVIKKWEGLKLRAYLCPAGVWTVGYGQTGPGVVKGTRWTQAQADAALMVEVVTRGRGVDAVVNVLLTANQKAALVSLVYNIGLSAFRRSTLATLLNKGSYAAAAGQFLRWNRAAGRVMPGLTNRRRDEQALYLGAA